MDVASGITANIPSDFTKPSSRYKSRAWIALAGLVGFIAIYLGLAIWLAWTCYRLIAAAINNPNGGSWFIGLGAGFLSIFLFKALIFIQRAKPNNDIELKAGDQPELFAFIYALADEIKAPRPYRVYLSPRVNAAVFYDLSLLNFIIPSRKNLEIGLGLVNVLNVGELKAVLAHEFGHFAQRTMAVGRWVYIAQQIAAHIVAKRDALDKLLHTISRMDVRIAWIGWLFRLLVWSIRSLVEVLFMGVLLAEKALSREMEFQADLVSVSVTGSDALVHALHKLSAADDAWVRAINFASAEKAAGRCTNDIFPLQTRVLDRMRNLLSDPSYGVAPSCATADRATFRVFKSSLAAPPQMWSTHPSNADREENAKRRYIAAAIDQRSAWLLFKNADSLKASVSKLLLGEAAASTPTLPPDQLFERLDQQYRMSYLDPAYHGVYFNRSTVRHAKSLSELYAPEPSDPLASLVTLYPETLSSDVERRRALQEESALLNGITNGTLRKSGDAIRFRGREVTRRELPALTAKVDTELAIFDDRLRQHDRLCRATHVALAHRISTIGGDGTMASAGWPEYLRGLLAVHHYATHAEAILRDATTHYQKTFRHQVTKRAGQKPNLDVILAAAKIPYRALARIHAEAASLGLDASLLARLGAPSWSAKLQELKLSEPAKGNLPNWVKVADGWFNSAIGNLGGLKFVAFEQLLDSERLVIAAAQKRFSADAAAPASGGALGPAPAPSVVPPDYPRLMPGDEISNVKPNWKTRLFGDGAPLPLLMRIGVAAAIIGFAIYSAGGAGHTSVTVYNGLGLPVQVSIANVSTTVNAFGHQRIDIPDGPVVHVHAAAGSRLIEDFDAKVTGLGAHDVYNIAGAGILVAWTANYGNVGRVPPRPLGAPRWVHSPVDHEFEQPPHSISSKTGGGSRTVLSGLSGESPEQVLGPLKDNRNEMIRVIRLHANWDLPSAQYKQQWSDLAQKISTAT
jgi:Zn-dependent protease with chaperone function